MEISFTDREADIMAVLWRRGPSTVAEVREELARRARVHDGADDAAHLAGQGLRRLRGGRPHASLLRRGGTAGCSQERACSTSRRSCSTARRSCCSPIWCRRRNSIASSSIASASSSTRRPGRAAHDRRPGWRMRSRSRACSASRRSQSSAPAGCAAGRRAGSGRCCVIAPFLLPFAAQVADQSPRRADSAEPADPSVAADASITARDSSIPAPAAEVGRRMSRIATSRGVASFLGMLWICSSAVLAIGLAINWLRMRRKSASWTRRTLDGHERARVRRHRSRGDRLLASGDRRAEMAALR